MGRDAWMVASVADMINGQTIWSLSAYEELTAPRLWWVPLQIPVHVYLGGVGGTWCYFPKRISAPENSSSAARNSSSVKGNGFRGLLDLL